MGIVNIRLVLADDSGGIRQSERQYIPLLKKHRVKVIGIVFGDTRGEYEDQGEDFRYVLGASLSGYSGGVLSRIFGVVRNYCSARVTGYKIYEILKTEGLSNDDIITVNIRRIGLVPVAIVLSKLTGAKILFHPGNSFSRGPFGMNHIYYWWLRHNKRINIIANSKYSAKSFRLEEGAVVYPGYSHERATKSVHDRDIRQELGIPEKRPLFLYMARVDWDKAPDLLVEGFLLSQQATENEAHLILAGPIHSDSLLKELNHLICNHGANSRVHIVGSQTDVANWYGAADVFVNSRRGVEPFGISIVEAMAAGLPILTSAVGGPAETVEDNVNGWLVHDLTVDGYRVAIDKSITSSELWLKYGELSKKKAMSFTSEEQVLKYLRYCADK